MKLLTYWPTAISSGTLHDLVANQFSLARKFLGTSICNVFFGVPQSSVSKAGFVPEIWWSRQKIGFFLGDNMNNLQCELIYFLGFPFLTSLDGISDQQKQLLMCDGDRDTLFRKGFRIIECNFGLCKRS